MQGVGGLWEKFAHFQNPIFSASLKHQAYDSCMNSEGLHTILVIWTIYGCEGERGGGLIDDMHGDMELDRG